MYEAGEPEIRAIAKVIRSKQLFRYWKHSQCARFESRYSKYLGVKFAHLTSSGTAALTAALTGMGIGPGDEVIVPMHTYMATAVAVLAVGAIPVIVNIDASLTLDPVEFENAIGPHTRAVIPVHMWGLPSDMTSIMRTARKHKLLVLEDACQAVGGGYEGNMLGSIGHAGAFSFNYFKNMTCGEGGAVVTNDKHISQRALCQIDCCGFYWTGKKGDVVPFVSNGSRASEIEGAMLNAQLDRIGSIIRKLRAQKKQILKETCPSHSNLAASLATRGPGLTPNPTHSPAHECGTYVMYLLPTPAQAEDFAKQTDSRIAGKTGRHNSTEWNPILAHRASLHDELNPFELRANQRLRKTYAPTQWQKSIDILNRTVMVATHPARSSRQVKSLIRTIKVVGAQILA